MANKRLGALLVCVAIACGAVGGVEAANILVNSNIVASETWLSTNTYILDKPIYVTNGATLTIQAGTVVRGDPESSAGAFDPGALVITRGSKIVAIGTSGNPIVFTDSNDDNFHANVPTPPYDTLENSRSITGQWGGVVLLSYGWVANNTTAAPNQAREVQIEGLTATGALGLYGNCAGFLAGPYGRNCDDSDSGTLRYASIRYGGFNLAANNEINGLTLGGVGRTTQIDHIEVFQNKDDQVEVFGGAAGLKNIATYAGGDDGLDYDEGWRGRVQFYFMVQGTPGADKSDKGGEWDGGNVGDNSLPMAIPDLYNLTFVGLGQKSFTARNENTPVHFRDNAGGRVYNSAFLDFGGANGLIEGTAASGTGANSSGERTQANYSAVADVNFYIQTPTTGKQLELTHDTWWCTANFDTNADTLPDFFSGTGGSAYGGAPADDTKIMFDPGIFSNGAFQNEYVGCDFKAPIRTLTRTDSGDPTRPDPVVLIDPRPIPTGPLVKNTIKPPPADGFFTPVAYRGAFSPDDNWAEGWTAMSRLGLFPTGTITVSDNITLSQVWTPDNEYVLDKPIYVTNGATLTIKPGTVVRGQGESSGGAFDPGALIIARGAKIEAQGTRQKPIVFTDLNDDNIGGNRFPNPPYDVLDNARSITGQWGGLILLSYGWVANNTTAAPNQAREVQIEGLTTAGSLGLYGNCAAFLAGPYGRNCDDSSSGTVSYTSIRYGGFNLAANNEINGLTLGGVGRATRLDHIEVFQNKDDQVEVFGGSPNLKYIATYAGGDDGLDYDEGFRGKVQFYFMVQGTPGTDKSDKGGEWDGGNVGDNSLPMAIPDLYNMTFVGLGQKSFTARNENTAMHFRDNAGGRVYNSAFLDFGGANGLIEGTAASGTGANSSGARTQADYSTVADANFYIQTPTTGKQLELTNDTWWCTANFDTNADTLPDFYSGINGSTYGGTPADNTKIMFDPGVFSNAAFANQYLGCATALPIVSLVRSPSGVGTTPDPVSSIDPRPTPAGPLATAAVKTPPADGFFSPVTYRGAFSPTENWAEGWTAMSRLGLFPTALPVNPPTILKSANIVASETWTANNQYVLDKPIYVTSGATLTIQPGTVVRGQGESSAGAFDPGTLIIARGAKINAAGTPERPIVFTDLSDGNFGDLPGQAPYDTFDNARGLTGQWGGVILLSYGWVANNTTAAPNQAREVQVEGLTTAGSLGLYGNCAAFLAGPYGRNCDDSDSGTLRYASIRYGGFNLAANNEINGLTLGGVGRTTQIDHIEVFQNKDDQVEVFGGAPGLKYIATYAGGDDGLDYDEGYRGRVQFYFMVQGTPGTDKSDKGGEWDGGNVGDNSLPMAIPDLYNLTFVGLGQKSFTARNENTVVHLRDNAGGRVYDSAFLDFGGANGLIEGTAASGTGANSSGERTQANYSAVADANFYIQTPTTGKQLELTNDTWWCTANFDTNGDTLPDFFSGTGGSAYGGTPADDTKIMFDPGVFSNAAFANQYLGCATALPIVALNRIIVDDPTRPDPVGSIDPRPTPGGPLLTGTVKPQPNDGFFERANYRGAFAPGSNWAGSWGVAGRLGLIKACDPNTPLGVDPDEVFRLRFDTKSVLAWTETWNGGSYDVIRSQTPSDFTAATCLEEGNLAIDEDTMAAETSIPTAGPSPVFYYLVRAKNPCGGEGTYGFRSSGVERIGTDCP